MGGGGGAPALGGGIAVAGEMLPPVSWCVTFVMIAGASCYQFFVGLLVV